MPIIPSSLAIHLILCIFQYFPIFYSNRVPIVTVPCGLISPLAEWVEQVHAFLGSCAEFSGDK
jgi:hypothetical protein